MEYELRSVGTAAEREAMHDIRRATLFAPGRHRIEVTYDEHHPDDLAPDHVPHLLMHNGVPIGVVRLDFRGERAVVRLVAITPELQGRGHGKVLDRLVGEAARRRGVRTLFVNAAATAVGFYEKCGWQRHVWDADELTGIAADCVQMRKAV